MVYHHENARDDDANGEASEEGLVSGAIGTERPEGGPLFAADDTANSEGGVAATDAAAAAETSDGPQGEADDGGRSGTALVVERSTAERHVVLLYDHDVLARTIRALDGRGGHDDDFCGPDDETPYDHDPSAEERHRLQQLRRIERGRLGPRRRLLVGTPEMLARVEALAAQAPHFSSFIGLVARAVALSSACGSPLRLAPVLLVGSPGIGKTWLLKKVAAALGTTSEFLAVNILDTWRLRGLNTSWRGARMGKIAEVLLASPTASPIIVLDEFEKAPSLASIDRPYDVFHSLLEEENAKSFVDDFLELPLRADHVLWVAAANGTAGLPGSILDRMLVIEVPDPTRAQLAAIVDGIYTTVCACHGEHFAPDLAGAVRDRLARHNPRQLKRIVAMALAFAAAAGRDALVLDDALRAIELASGASHEGGFRHPIGFTPSAN